MCLIETKEEKSPAQVLREIIDLIFVSKNLTEAIARLHYRYGVDQPGIDNFVRRNVRQKTILQFTFENQTNRYRRPLRFTKLGVKKLLINPLLVGDLAYFFHSYTKDTIYYPGVFKDRAIISPIELVRLKALLKNPNYQSPPKSKHPYTGVIYCTHCGNRYRSVNRKKRKDGSYVKAYRCPNSKVCQGKAINHPEVEKVVIAKLVEKHRQIARVGQPETEREHSPPYQALVHQLTQLSNMSQTKAITLAIEATKKEMKQMLIEEQSNRAFKQENITLLESIFANPLYWETLKDTEKWQINQLLIERIEIMTKNEKSYVGRIDLSTKSP